MVKIIEHTIIQSDRIYRRKVFGIDTINSSKFNANTLFPYVSKRMKEE